MPLSDFTAVSSIIQLSTAPKTEWESVNPVLPSGLPGWESDTKKMKVGDGTSTWTELDYTVDATLTPEQKAMLDNAGDADGVALLDGNGLLPLDRLPNKAKSHIRYMADIAARDATDPEVRESLFVVLDATADSTVESGAAIYAWDHDSEEWVKISEMESMDIDFSVFFHKENDTLDDLSDGTNYIRFTPAEREKLAKAMVIDETYILAGLTPSELAAAMEPSGE